MVNSGVILYSYRTANETSDISHRADSEDRLFLTDNKRLILVTRAHGGQSHGLLEKYVWATES